MRLLALDHIIIQKFRTARAYNKRVKPKCFKEGELVWKTVLPIGNALRILFLANGHPIGKDHL